MMHFPYLIPTLILLAGANTAHANLISVRALENSSCTGHGGAPGVCIPTTKCSSGGGQYISNACPGTPDDIKCCTKTSCGAGGNCRFTSQCNTNTLTGLCPGPADFQCCVPNTGTGPYPPPSYPAVGACKAISVSGAKKIVAGNQGKVRQIYCKRDCACPGDSEHCCGLAVDLMCSSAGGVRTTIGQPIAEWVMNNHATLNLKYVIWGQKIWNPSRDSVKPWSQWRPMKDRGSVTANHWDHVHVSFNG